MRGIKFNTEWMSFWETLAGYKEEDVLECEAWYGNIVNNGDCTFMWEDSWEPVRLNGEHTGTKWRIVSK